jgi:triacylglycerol lipase
MVAYLTIAFFSLFPPIKKPAPDVDGLQVKEAMEMVSLCSTFPFSMYFEHYNALVPFGYRMVGSTRETPLHNVVRVFKKENTLVLVFRGTIEQSNSWLENIHFMQVPAGDAIFVENVKYNYQFSSQVDAAVHSGYVLATVYLWNELRHFLDEKTLTSTERIILTGHSQGGALAQLFLAQMDLMEDFQNIKLRSYSFGSPRIGNQAFTDDFNQRFLVNNQSFRFVNPADLVCKLPIINKKFEFNIAGFQTSLDLESVNHLLQFGKQFLPEDKQSTIDKTVESSLRIAANYVKEKVGNVTFPAFASTLFYGETGKTIVLDAQPYPAYLETQIQTQDASWLSTFSSAKETLKREMTFFQHSIFTYYNAIYTHYDAKHFRRIRLQTLPEKMI